MVMVLWSGCAVPERDPAQRACEVVDAASVSIRTSTDPSRAPELRFDLPYLIRLPASGVGFVRLRVTSGDTLLLHARERGVLRRIVEPFAFDSTNGAPLVVPADELCGDDGLWRTLGIGGSNEYCRERIRDHRYFNVTHDGDHFVELRGAPDAAVWVLVTTGRGHAFVHYDPHAHH